jgi:hypothetical protein
MFLMDCPNCPTKVSFHSIPFRKTTTMVIHHFRFTKETIKRRGEIRTSREVLQVRSHYYQGFWPQTSQHHYSLLYQSNRWSLVFHHL